MYITERIRSLFEGTNWLIIPAALFAVIFHELAHGFVAYLLGDSTAKNEGRLSLNPIKHLDVLGLLCMIFFGFGWAKPVPVTPSRFKNRRFGMFLVSLAGPLSNLISAFVALLLGHLMMVHISPQSSVTLSICLILVEFFFVSALLNIGLAVFNLIPIPPLDGSKILFSFLPRRAFRFIITLERYGMIILIVLINLPFFSNILSDVRGFLFSSISNLVSLLTS